MKKMSRKEMDAALQSLVDARKDDPNGGGGPRNYAMCYEMAYCPDMVVVATEKHLCRHCGKEFTLSLTQDSYDYYEANVKGKLLPKGLAGDYLDEKFYRVIADGAAEYKKAGYDAKLEYICYNCIKKNEKNGSMLQPLAFLFRAPGAEEYTVSYPMGADYTNFEIAYGFLQRCKDGKFGPLLGDEGISFDFAGGTNTANGDAENIQSVFDSFVPGGFNAENVDNALERILGIRPKKNTAGG